MSLGIALGLRLDRIHDAHVFALLSDGDCQEGQTWEAAMAAAHFGVSNLTAIVDYNHLQTDGTTEEVMDIKDVRTKFEAFAWDAVEIDGHDMAAGRRVRSSGAARVNARAAIVCQTRKGCGVSLMEDHVRLSRQAAHRRAGRAGADRARGDARPSRTRSWSPSR